MYSVSAPIGLPEDVATKSKSSATISSSSPVHQPRFFNCSEVTSGPGSLPARDSASSLLTCSVCSRLVQYATKYSCGTTSNNDRRKSTSTMPSSSGFINCVYPLSSILSILVLPVSGSPYTSKCGVAPFMRSTLIARKLRSSAPTGTPGYAGSNGRSEEHTSELQSRFDLVCRL